MPHGRPHGYAGTQRHRQLVADDMLQHKRSIHFVVQFDFQTVRWVLLELHDACDVADRLACRIEIDLHRKTSRYLNPVPFLLVSPVHTDKRQLVEPLSGILPVDGRLVPCLVGPGMHLPLVLEIAHIELLLQECGIDDIEYAQQPHIPCSVADVSAVAQLHILNRPTCYLILVDAKSRVRMAMLRKVLNADSEFLLLALPVHVEGGVGVEAVAAEPSHPEIHVKLELVVGELGVEGVVAVHGEPHAQLAEGEESVVTPIEPFAEPEGAGFGGDGVHLQSEVVVVAEAVGEYLGEVAVEACPSLLCDGVWHGEMALISHIMYYCSQGIIVGGLSDQQDQLSHQQPRVSCRSGSTPKRSPPGLDITREVTMDLHYALSIVVRSTPRSLVLGLAASSIRLVGPLKWHIPQLCSTSGTPLSVCCESS